MFVGDFNVQGATFAVTYGGVTLSQVSGSPFGFTMGAELNGQHLCFFLGSNIPTGPQTVAVTFTGFSDKYKATALTFTAGFDCIVEDTTGVDQTTSAANPTAPLTIANESAFVGAVMSGQDAISGIAPGSGMTQVGAEVDFGAETYSVVRKTALASSNATVDWTATAAVYAVFAVAVTEFGGLVVADASHSNTGDNVTLTQAHTLTVADAFHASTAEVAGVTQDQSVTVPGYPWLLEDGTVWLLEDDTPFLTEEPYVQFTIGVATAVFAVGLKTTTPIVAGGAAHAYVGVTTSHAGVKVAAPPVIAPVHVFPRVVGALETTGTVRAAVALNAAPAAGVKDTTAEPATPTVGVRGNAQGSSNLNPEGRAATHLAVAATAPASKQAAATATPQLAVTADVVGTKDDSAVGHIVLVPFPLAASIGGGRGTTGTARLQVGLTSSAIRFKEAAGTATPLVAITAQIGFRVAHTGQARAYLGIMGARSAMSGRIRLPFISQLETADHILEGANA